MDKFEIILKQTKNLVNYLKKWDLKEYFSKLEVVKLGMALWPKGWPCIVHARVEA